MLLLLAALVVPSIHTDFEGGALGKIEKVSDTHFRLAVKGESDQDHRNRQANWYYFRMDGAPAQTLTLDMVDLKGEYNYILNQGAVTKDTPPFISYDGTHWEHLTTYEFDPAEPKMILHVTPRGRHFWIAHCQPYTNQTLDKLRHDIKSNHDFHEEVIGKTVGGRDLVLWTIGNGPKTVWLMFRQHSWETGSSFAGDGAVRTLLANTPESRSLRERVTWKMFPLCDPDGAARGGVRFNANGFDLNRNWDVVDAVKMPEITAQREAVRKWLNAGHHIDFFLSLHNDETNEYLEGPPDPGGKGQFKELSERVFNTLDKETSFAPSRKVSYATETTTAGKPGRMNVSQGLYKDFGIAAYIMEQRCANNPKLGHHPDAAERSRFGGELVKALAKAVSE